MHRTLRGIRITKLLLPSGLFNILPQVQRGLPAGRSSQSGLLNSRAFHKLIEIARPKEEAWGHSCSVMAAELVTTRLEMLLHPLASCLSVFILVAPRCPNGLLGTPLPHFWAFGNVSAERSKPILAQGN